MANIIPVSFKENDSDTQLYNDIMQECKMIGKSTWMKIAAMEKLKNDKEKTNNLNNNVTNSQLPFLNTNNNRTIKPVDSFDELF